MCNQPLFALYFSIWEILRGVYSPFHSLSLYPFHLFLSLSLSLSLSLFISLISPSLSISIPPSLYLSFYLSFSLSPSLSLISIILFGVSNGRFRPCFLINCLKTRAKVFFNNESQYFEMFSFSGSFRKIRF